LNPVQDSAHIELPVCPSTAAAPHLDTFFRQVVEGMRCGIMTLDRAGHVTTVNDLAREILEIELDGGEPQPVRDVLRHHPRLAEVLLDALVMTHLPNRAELELRTQADDGRTIGFTISPILGEADEGPLQGIALFFKDLTQVERHEEQERLRDRLAALGQMAASLAHEIRNPLASIDVTATLLKRRLRGRDEDLRLVRKILDEVHRLNRTVTQGLEFTRSISPELVRQPVEPLLDEAWDEASARFPGHRVRLERRYAAGTPEVPLDANYLRPVFVNLVVNAIEAVEREGRVELETRGIGGEGTAPHAVEVLIRDDGPGIPPEVREKIFHPFVTTKPNGSGIGLAMARKIVESHHGLLDVETGAGAGTCFRIRLRCEPDEKVEP
jgi:signal transduction histidine kinase